MRECDAKSNFVSISFLFLHKNFLCVYGKNAAVILPLFSPSMLIHSNTARKGRRIPFLLRLTKKRARKQGRRNIKRHGENNAWRRKIGSSCGTGIV